MNFWGINWGIFILITLFLIAFLMHIYTESQREAKEDREQISGLEDRNEKLERKIESLEEDIENLNENINDLEDKNNTLDSLIDKLKEENNNLKDKGAK
jgi:peptidoglycan hydrolase CwlO-like protein